MNAVLESSKSELRIINNRLQRQRELRKRIFLFGFTIAFVIVLVTIFGCVKSFASDSEHVTLYKYYTSVQVKPGDTLWSISEEYVQDGKNTVKSFISEVQLINGMEENEALKAGNYIVVPYYSQQVNNS